LPEIVHLRSAGCGGFPVGIFWARTAGDHAAYVGGAVTEVLLKHLLVPILKKLDGRLGQLPAAIPMRYQEREGLAVGLAQLNSRIDAL
jgi:hypothetical protein